MPRLHVRVLNDCDLHHFHCQYCCGGTRGCTSRLVLGARVRVAVRTSGKQYVDTRILVVDLNLSWETDRDCQDIGRT